MYRGNHLCLSATSITSLPCHASSITIQCILMSYQERMFRMVISIHPDKSSTYTTASICPTNEDEPPSLIATQDVAALYACLPQLVELHEVSPLSYALKKSEIKATFGKAINMNDLEHAVCEERRKRDMAQKGDKLDVADVAKQWAREHRDDWAYDGRAKLWRHWNGCYWEALEPRSALLDLEAIAALHEAEIDIHSSGLMDCFQRIAAAECTMIFTEGQGKINFENGTLDLETMTLYPFKREDYLTYCLPYCYAPGNHPTISRFLKDTIPDVHARQAYMAHLGLALMQVHFVLLLLGP